MPVMKQKSIQPATSVPYAEGILVANNTAGVIPANRLVTFARGASTATSGTIVTVELADSASAANAAKPLLITKHSIPVGKRGVCLPWKMFTGINTSALALGASVYLDAAASGGQIKLTAGATGNARFVGIVFVVSATVGEVLVCPTMMAAQN